MNNTDKMNDLLPVLGCLQVVLDGILLLFSFVIYCQWPVRPTITFKPLVIFVHQSVSSISEKKRKKEETFTQVGVRG